jgi:hypothetical protein
MTFTEFSLTACFGSWLALSSRKARTLRLLVPRGRMLSLAVLIAAFAFVPAAQAQQPHVTPDSNAIMGFESLGTWSVKGNSSSPGFMLASTTNRTQGSAAYSIANPPNLMKLTSQAIASDLAS